MKTTFRNLLLTSALATTLTACGGGGGGGGAIIEAGQNVARGVGWISVDNSIQTPINQIISGVSADWEIDKNVKTSDIDTFLTQITTFNTLNSQLDSILAENPGRITTVDQANAVKRFKNYVKFLNNDLKPILQTAKTNIQQGNFLVKNIDSSFYSNPETFMNGKLTTYNSQTVEELDVEYKEVTVDGETKLVTVEKDSGTVYYAGSVKTKGDNGKAILKTSTSAETLTNTTNTVVEGDSATTYTDWTEGTVSDNTRTDTRTKTVTTQRTKRTVKTYTTTTTITYHDGTTSSSSTTREVVTSTALSPSIAQTVETQQIVIEADPVITASTNITGEVVTTTYGSAVDGDPTYSDWSVWSTDTTSTADSTTDVDNGDGTITRTVTRTTTYNQSRTRTKSVQTYRAKTVRTTDYTLNTYSDGTTTKTNQTYADTTTQETYGDLTVTTETETRTTDNSPGVVVSTTTINNSDTAYTDSDSNLGTKTPGYSTDKSTYETAEYLGMNGGGGDVLGSVNASSAYSRGWTGKGSTIAILDTGIDQDHQSFTGKISATKCYVDCTNGIEDQHGHGTHVAGIAAGNKNDSVFHGVAFDSNIVAAKVAYNNGAYSLFYARQGVDWAADQGAIVANISANSTLNYGNITNKGNGIYTSSDIQYLEEDADDWVNLRTQDIVVVNSAGNQGKKYAAKPGILATMTDANGDLYMGGKMLIVGNYYPNYSVTNGGNLAGTSNAAGHLCQNWNAGTSSCDDQYRIWDFYIMAPGQQVKSAGLNGSSATMSGTSMAAPVVSGSVAILHQMWPYMTADNLVKLVLQTANKDIHGYDEKKHGQGLLDLDEATKPQGAVGIVTTGGNVSNAQVASLSNTGGAGGSVAQLSSILDNVMVVDEYKRDYYINLAQGITAKDTRKVSSIWAKANGWSANSFTQKYGSFSQGGEFKASNFTSMPFFTEDTYVGLYSGENGGQDWGSNILKKWKLGKGLKLKTGVGFMSEQNTWLGNSTDGALTVGKNNGTKYATVGVEYELGDSVFTFDFDQGKTDVNTKSGSLITGFDTLTTQSMKLGWEKQLSSNEKWGITYSLPNHITKGSANLNIPSATNLNGDIIYQDHRADMRQQTKEKNIGMYYSHQAENETDWQTTFSIEYRQNVAGVAGDDKVAPQLQVSKRFWGACMKIFGMANNKPFCKKIRAEKKLAKLKKGKNKKAIAKVEKQIATLNKEIALGWNK